MRSEDFQLTEPVTFSVSVLTLFPNGVIVYNPELGFYNRLDENSIRAAISHGVGPTHMGMRITTGSPPLEVHLLGHFLGQRENDSVILYPRLTQGFDGDNKFMAPGTEILITL